MSVPTSISIILSGGAYQPRIKGEIKKLLSGMKITILGNGSTFTGFIVESSSLEEVKSRIEKYLKLDGVSLEEVEF
jgi:hypothetical protein